jgi:hypothetical protein
MAAFSTNFDFEKQKLVAAPLPSWHHLQAMWRFVQLHRLLHLSEEAWVHSLDQKVSITTNGSGYQASR